MCDVSDKCDYGEKCSLTDQESDICLTRKKIKDNRNVKNVEILQILGGKEWSRAFSHRVYFNMNVISKIIGLRCKISIITNENNEPEEQEMSIIDAGKLLKNILSARIYYDVNDSAFHSYSFGYIDELTRTINKMIDKIQGKPDLIT